MSPLASRIVEVVEDTGLGFSRHPVLGSVPLVDPDLPVLDETVPLTSAGMGNKKQT